MIIIIITVMTIIRITTIKIIVMISGALALEFIESLTEDSGLKGLHLWMEGRRLNTEPFGDRNSDIQPYWQSLLTKSVAIPQHYLRIDFYAYICICVCTRLGVFVIQPTAHKLISYLLKLLVMPVQRLNSKDRRSWYEA